MNTTLTLGLLTMVLLAAIAGSPNLDADAALSEPIDLAIVDSVHAGTSMSTQDLAAIVSTIAPISREAMVRRRIAQATFCLPQNALGIVCSLLLQVSGAIVETAEMNEMKVIVTRAPFGVSLGRYIILHTSLLSEFAVRHEYGHTMQGYKHGPFYLFFEGTVSFVQAAFSVISPSFAADYYDRWPENEANELGGI